MPKLPSRFRRLDDILGDLPVDEPLLLTELDGYLTGIAVGPASITPAEWLPPIWGGEDGDQAPFDDPIDVQLFAEMVTARYGEIVRDLGRGKHQPIFDVDERNGEVLWEAWVDGFEMAMAVRPDSWSAVKDSGDVGAVAALSYMLTLADVVRDETELTSAEINAICDQAPRLIPGHMGRLYAWRVAHGRAPSGPSTSPAKIGRNDPCLCGSGKKHKRCCGTT